MPYNAQDCRTTLRISRSCCRLRCPIAVVPGYATANRRSCSSPIGFGTLIYRLLAHRPVSFEHCGLASYFLVSIVQLSAAGPSEVGAHCAVTSSRSSATASCLPPRRSFDASSRNQLHDPLQGPGAPDALVTAHCAVVIGELLPSPGLCGLSLHTGPPDRLVVVHLRLSYQRSEVFSQRTETAVILPTFSKIDISFVITSA